MLKISTKNKNPNFTIILPGTCQAKCGFCFWKEDKNYKNFLNGLKIALEELPPIFTQISISGGEPSISPVFNETMDLIREYKSKGKFNKVVLTSNGINLLKLNLNGINHINISRHAVFFDDNAAIFKTNKIPDNKLLIETIKHCNKFGIDVNFNTVFVDNINDKIPMESWINMVKSVNGTSITFRNQYGNYGTSILENDLLENDYKPSIITTCPVCRTSTFYIDGIKVRFHSSDYEPTESDKFDENEVYEVILQQNGNLTRDWEEKKILIDVNQSNELEDESELIMAKSKHLILKEKLMEFEFDKPKIDKNEKFYLNLNKINKKAKVFYHISKPYDISKKNYKKLKDIPNFDILKKDNYLKKVSFNVEGKIKFLKLNNEKKIILSNEKQKEQDRFQKLESDERKFVPKNVDKYK